MRKTSRSSPKSAKSSSEHDEDFAQDVADLQSVPPRVSDERTPAQSQKQKKTKNAKMSAEHFARRARILETVLESVGDAIVAVDTDGRVLFANQEGEALVALGVGDATLRQWPAKYGLFHPTLNKHFPPAELPLLRAAKGQVTDDVEILVRSPIAPKGRLFSVNGRPLYDEDGKLQGGVATFRDITDARRAHDLLLEQAVTDNMTMIPNHRAFWQRLTQLIAEGQRGRQFCLVLVDIDHFKHFNDSFGHQVGDYVLIAVANTLSDHVRRTDLVARYGGEEFCVLYADIDGPTACRLAAKLRAHVAKVDAPSPVTASFGVCAFSKEKHADGQALVRDADAALYRAKNAGRNCVRSFEDLTK